MNDIALTSPPTPALVKKGAWRLGYLRVMMEAE